MLLFLSLLTGVAALQCIDENNKPVDWFVVYKFPRLKHENKPLQDGVAYAFMTSDNYETWTFSNSFINNTDSIVGKTLQPFYENRDNLMYLLYNDQPPDEKSKSNKGHNKGVILANNEGGLWLIHSVPHFPDFSSSYTYPKTGANFGQSFLCISLDLKNLNNVGIQLQYNEPEIYGENIPANLISSLPELAKAASNITVDISPWFNVANINSKDNVEFISFAKSNNFNKDLYEDLVAPQLQTDLLVETWPDGPGRLTSNCSKTFKVYNVKSLFVNIANATFTTTEDHSKWAVSPAIDKNQWICVGDINRAEHQKLRGGGTVCLNNKQLAKNYQTIIESVENCPATLLL